MTTDFPDPPPEVIRLFLRMGGLIVLIFGAQSGPQIELTERVGMTRYREVSVGGTFELLYLESEPERVEVIPGSNWFGARVLQGISLAFGLVWLAFLWRCGSWAVGAGRARRYGRIEQVVVTEVRRTNVKVNKQPRYRLVWRDAKGREGESILAPQSRFDTYQAGDKIMVYHGIKHMWWNGDVGRRAP